jgi:calcium-dependent protein kinase
MFSKNSFELKIIDFGLSFQYDKDMKEELKQKNKNKLIGTSYYIAPEVIELNCDQRCDIWSAGVMLYILSTATPPFDGTDDS